VANSFELSFLVAPRRLSPIVGGRKESESGARKESRIKTKLRGFALRANYADRPTASCWRSSANFCG
jgi:hypothetical protein